MGLKISLIDKISTWIQTGGFIYRILLVNAFRMAIRLIGGEVASEEKRDSFDARAGDGSISSSEDLIRARRESAFHLASISVFAAVTPWQPP